MIRNTCINRSFAEQTFWWETLMLFQVSNLISERNKNKADKVLEFLCMCVCVHVCLCVCVHAHNPCTSSLCCLITKAKYKDVSYVCIIQLLKINLNFHLFLHRQWRWLAISCMIYLYREKVTRLHVILRKYVDLRKRKYVSLQRFLKLFLGTFPDK